MFKCAIFDLDDTLIISEKMRLDTYRRAIEEVCGIRISYDVRDLIGQSPDKNFLKLLGPLFYEKSKELFECRNKMLLKEASVGLEKIPSTNFILDKLSRLDIPTAIASNSETPYVKTILKSIDLEDLFYVCGDMVLKRKPDPELFVLVADTFGVSCEDCLVFEDSPSGIQAATAACMRSVGVLGYFNKTELEGASDFLGHQDIVKAESILRGFIGVIND